MAELDMQPSPLPSVYLTRADDGVEASIVHALAGSSDN